MKTKITGLNSDFKLPQTNVYSLLDDQLLIFLRSWNGNDVLQKVVDEVTHFLSAANADLEITTPFEYLQNLSSVANKVRISVLLANDVILKSENKDQFRQGFELAIIFKNHNELAWSTVGRFQITAKKMKTILPISHGGQFLDDQVLLPVALLGIDRQPTVLAGSISIKNLDEIQILSSFADMMTYWEAVITDFTAINE